MSIYGKWVAATIASGAMVSSAIDLGREYDYLSIQIPEMDTCQMYLQVAEITGGTYYDLGMDSTTSNEGFNHADVWRLGGWRFIKVACTTPQTAERLVRVCGMRY